MDKDFEKKIIDIYNNLNNGLSWDKIEKTKYEEIEKKREQNASVSDFSKLIFKLKNNENLLYISKNIEELDKQKDVICVTCNYAEPHQHARMMNHNYKYLKDYNIDSVPFLKKNIIYRAPNVGDGRFYDC